MTSAARMGAGAPHVDADARMHRGAPPARAARYSHT